MNTSSPGKQRGFTLIEIAIVILIISILLGYTVAMFPVQQELKQYRQADQEMDDIMEAIYAFAQTNGYLPCPAWTDDILDSTPTVTSDGFECRDANGTAADCDGGDPTADNCDVRSGYVPAKVLGLNGRYSEINQLLLDPWGMPYQYSVTGSDEGAGGQDYVLVDGIPDAGGMSALEPDLSICSVDPSAGAAGSDSDCNGAANTIFGDSGGGCDASSCSPLVILSTGKDRLVNTADNSWIQRENLDADQVFVKTAKSELAGSEYDDLIRWVAPNVLYSRMLEAEQQLQP